RGADVDSARVRFEPWGAEAEVPEGATVLDAARAAGVDLLSTCGGRGTCGLCAVKILHGTPASIRHRQAGSVLPDGVVLACQAEASDGLVVQPIVLSRRSRP
ncbi:MAG: 2Fe-2S iron-sulfur cluster binding domain-containing protein, partial [Coriobacteriia bacterium]|nr:2Fe-2S iron-sulfur cluster binding domain-containing protein [Coriobacteriia bacterium]